MSVKMDDKRFYRTEEAAAKIGISRSTLLRWFTIGVLEDSISRDRRGWRLFTEADINKIKTIANHVE